MHLDDQQHLPNAISDPKASPLAHEGVVGEEGDEEGRREVEPRASTSCDYINNCTVPTISYIKDEEEDNNHHHKHHHHHPHQQQQELASLAAKEDCQVTIGGRETNVRSVL